MDGGVSARLEPIGSIQPPGPEPEATRILDAIARILRNWGVSGCIPVEGGMVSGNVGEFWSLVKLGVRYVPVEGDCRVSLDVLGIYADFEQGQPEAQVYGSALDLALRGKPTPLVRLRWTPGEGARVWAKLEWYNPFSLSIKDRPATYILSRQGLEPGSRVYEASSSNFAVAITAASRNMGLKPRVYLPRPAKGGFGEIVSRLMGAEVVVDETVELAPMLMRRVSREARAEGAVFTNQFLNDLNFESHLRGIAREIDYQRLKAGLDLRGVAGGIGTSGHMTAISFYMSNRLPGVETILAQPAKGENIPGIRRTESGMLWLSIVDLDYRLYDASLEDALAKVEEVARSDGLVIGPSGGAVIHALEQHCNMNKCKGDYIAVIPDTGYKYLSLLARHLGV